MSIHPGVQKLPLKLHVCPAKLLRGRSDNCREILLDAWSGPSSSQGNPKHPCKSALYRLVPLFLTLKGLHTAQICCNLALSFFWLTSF